MLEARPDRVRKYRDGIIPISCQLRLNELPHLDALIFIQDVNLREKKRDVGGVSAQVSDQLDVVLRERRVDADRDQSQPHVRKPFQGSIRIVLEDALEPRRVDEPNPPVAIHRRKLDAHASNLLEILRVPTFRNEIADPIHGRLFSAAIGKQNLGSLVSPPLDLGDDGRDRDHSDRQQRPAEKMIEKTALSGLEAPQDGYVQRLLLREGAAAFEKILQRGDLMAFAQVLDRAEHIMYDLGGDRRCVRFGHVETTLLRSWLGAEHLLRADGPNIRYGRSGRYPSFLRRPEPGGSDCQP